MATTSNAASVWVSATASLVPYLFLRGALVAGPASALGVCLIVPDKGDRTCTCIVCPKMSDTGL
jgi:hypothetical protein